MKSPKGAKPPRVVMLDDEPCVLNSLRMMMQSQYPEADILTFTDVEDAMRELDKRAPDVFMTDHNHLGLSGADLATQLVQRGVPYPILIISAIAESLEPAIAAGQYWPESEKVILMAKPFTFADLWSKVEQYSRSWNLPRSAGWFQETVTLPA